MKHFYWVYLYSSSQKWRLYHFRNTPLKYIFQRALSLHILAPLLERSFCQITFSIVKSETFLINCDDLFNSLICLDQDLSTATLYAALNYSIFPSLHILKFCHSTVYSLSWNISVHFFWIQHHSDCQDLDRKCAGSCQNTAWMAPILISEESLFPLGNFRAEFALFTFPGPL